ncbi:hypothetical protein ON010_g9482 [Phytophthora cinnamomi]|nr:hypothetical protein ON010_g9482 [Phytophthora cinnamomi]
MASKTAPVSKAFRRERHPFSCGPNGAVKFKKSVQNLSFVIAQLVAADGAVQLSETFGGPHGSEFSDQDSIVGGETVSSITIRAGARIDGVSLDISGPTPQTFVHGYGGTSNTNSVMQLGGGEYITSMEAHWDKNRHTDQHTRVFYLKFATNLGNSVSTGTLTDHTGSVTAPPGYQLAGFHGRGDNGRIDLLGAIWSAIPATSTPAPATPVPDTAAPETLHPAIQTQLEFESHSASSSTDGSVAAAPDVIIVSESPTPSPAGPATQLSEVFGGPHGSEFSDQALVTSGQTVSSIAIRAGARIDGITLENRHTNQRTRIYYLKFVTSTGRSVSGGSATDYSATVTTPEGYQLGGFFGRGGQEIYRLGVVWNSIAVAQPSPSSKDGEDMQLSGLYGGPRGTAFSDIQREHAHARSWGILRVNGGSLGKNRHTGDRTRVFYLNFITNAKNSVSGGSKTVDSTVVTAPSGFQLAGFYGRATGGGSGNIDQIGAIWTRMSVKDLSLTDEMENFSSGVSYVTTIRNWVGPTIGIAGDAACYRKSVGFGGNKVCPLGYSNDDDDCMTQCPLAYPVECFAECLPQNDDCALAVLHKIGSVVAVALNVATGGVFGSMYSAFKSAKRAITCAASIVKVVRGLIYYLRYRQTSTPQGDTAELLTVAYQADVVLFDLPVAVCVCMGFPIPKKAQYADTVLVIVEGIVKQAITNGDEIVSTGENVLKLLTEFELRLRAQAPHRSRRARSERRSQFDT